MLPLQEVEGVIEVVLDTVEVRQREGDVDTVEDTEGDGLPVLLTLPHLLTLEHPLPVMDREGEVLTVPVTEGVVLWEEVKQRVGDMDTVAVALKQPVVVADTLPLLDTLGLPLPVLDTEVVLQVVGVIVLVVVTVLDKQRVGV